MQRCAGSNHYRPAPTKSHRMERAGRVLLFTIFFPYIYKEYDINILLQQATKKTLVSTHRRDQEQNCYCKRVTKKYSRRHPRIKKFRRRETERVKG